MEYQQQANYQQSIGNLPTSSANEKTLLWSQPGQYMIDSGYTTQAPSICSMDMFEQMDVVPQQQPQQQQPPSRPDWDYNKVQPMDDMNKQMMPPQQPIQPQQQQQATCELSDNALENWMNYQDNSEMAIKAIPDLIKLLNDEDHVVVSQAAMLVSQMSKKKTSCLALIDSPNCVTSLVNSLANDVNIETAKNVVGTFYNISMYQQGILSIIKSNAIPPLVNLLSVPMESVVSFAITTLHNVLLARADIKDMIRKYGGIQKMVPLLRKHTNAKFLAIVVDCLQLLSISHPQSKLIILECGGPELLVEILRHNTYPKLILMTFKLLKVLSVCTQNKKALLHFGAMQALATHLANSTTNELQNCLITLRNLSDAATRINGLEELIEQLIKLIASSDDAVSTLAAGILSNLTCNNEANKLAVLKYNGIPILLRVIDTSILKVQLVEPCICTIRHITNRYQEAIKAQEQVRLHNGFEIFTNILHMQPRRWSILKATLGVIRNFATNPANMQILKSFFVIEKLMQALYDAYNETQRQQFVEEVNLLDIIESCSNILILLAKDFQNQLIMKEIGCIPFFVQLIYSPLQSMQRISASLLAELVQNKECVEIIDQQAPLHGFLQKSLQNFANDSTLGNYAKIIMQHIQEYKTQKQYCLFQQQQQQQQQMNFNMQSWNNQPQPFAQQQQQQQDFFGDSMFGSFNQPPQQNMFQQQQQQPQQSFDGFTVL